MLSVVLPVWLYFSLSEASTWQATIGKRLLGLHVTNANGKRIGLAHSFLRSFLKLIPWNFVHIGILVPASTGIILLGQLPSSMEWWWSFLITADVLTLLYLITPLFTGGRRSLYDLIYGTRVSWSQQGGKS